jgi:hypothetical protein
MNDLLKGNKTKFNKLAEELMIRNAVKREKFAETKASHIVEEIAVAMKKKGIKEWRGSNYILTIV